MDLVDLSTIRGIDAWQAHEAEIRGRMSEIDTQYSGVALPDAERAEMLELRDRLAKHVQPTIRELQARAQMLVDLGDDPTRAETPGAPDPTRRTPPTRTRTPEDIHDLYAYRSLSNSAEQEVRAMRDGAMREIERATFPHPDAQPEKIREHIQRLLDKDATGELARYILSTSHPIYQRAFPRLVYNKPLTSEQARAAEQVERAIATVGTTTTGGNAITYTFDPSLMLTSSGSSNPLRQIARVETIVTGNTWKGVTSAGLTFSRGATEGSAVTEGTPTVAQPSVTVQPVKGELDFSIEADEDWPQLQSEMAMVIQDARDTEEADAFVNGTGTPPAPEGISYGLAAASDVGTGADGLSLDDISRIVSRVPDRFEPNASWLAHRSFYETVGDLDRAVGASPTWQNQAAGVPASLRGYPRYNSSAMEDQLTTSSARIAILGDFRRGFIIVDKVGLTIELDPHVRDGNGKWTGQRALLVHYRNSSLVLIDNAFRALKVGEVQS